MRLRTIQGCWRSYDIGRYPENIHATCRQPLRSIDIHATTYILSWWVTFRRKWEICLRFAKSKFCVEDAVLDRSKAFAEFIIFVYSYIASIRRVYKIKISLIMLNSRAVFLPNTYFRSCRSATARGPWPKNWTSAVSNSSQDTCILDGNCVHKTRSGAIGMRAIFLPNELKFLVGGGEGTLDWEAG